MGAEGGQARGGGGGEKREEGEGQRLQLIFHVLIGLSDSLVVSQRLLLLHKQLIHSLRQGTNLPFQLPNPAENAWWWKCNILWFPNIRTTFTSLPPPSSPPSLPLPPSLLPSLPPSFSPSPLLLQLLPPSPTPSLLLQLPPPTLAANLNPFPPPPPPHH